MAMTVSFCFSLRQKAVVDSAACRSARNRCCPHPQIQMQEGPRSHRYMYSETVHIHAAGSLLQLHTAQTDTDLQQNVLRGGFNVDI